jgi:hypothetical protein
MKNILFYEAKSCFETFKGQEENIDKIALEYLDFLSTCKTERETVKWIEDICVSKNISTNSKDKIFYRKLKDKTIILIRRGKRPLKEGLRILGAHLDTPRLDFKQHPIYENTYLAMVKTHYYGGIRKHQWFSIPLAIHGIVVKTDGTKINLKIGEDPKDPVFVIPDLLPHLAYKQNEQKLSKAFEAEKMNAIIGNIPYQEDDTKDIEEKIKFYVLKILYEKYGIICVIICICIHKFTGSQRYFFAFKIFLIGRCTNKQTHMRIFINEFPDIVQAGTGTQTVFPDIFLDGRFRADHKIGILIDQCPGKVKVFINDLKRRKRVLFRIRIYIRLCNNNLHRPLLLFVSTVYENGNKKRDQQNSSRQGSPSCLLPA